MRSSIIIRVCLLAAFLHGVAFAEALPVNEKWLPKDNDLRILEVHIESYTFDDVIPAYKYEDVILLPLGTLTEIMELAVNVKPGAADGFVIREDRTFFLDISRKEIIINGKPESFD
ncbi:MAG: hypothetical protein KAT90_07005, partial [Gammaproteobacteria bacterium]|nr:hypothetical protein [Gammaproteobacteria bacterium]